MVNLGRRNVSGRPADARPMASAAPRHGKVCKLIRMLRSQGSGKSVGLAGSTPACRRTERKRYGKRGFSLHGIPGARDDFSAL